MRQRGFSLIELAVAELALGTKLAVASVVPNIEACGATTFGSSWMYVFSLENGWGAIEGGLVAEKADNGIVSFSALQVQEGTALMGTDSKGQVKRISTEIGRTGSALRRSAWRELVD